MSALILVVDDEPDVADLFVSNSAENCAPRASSWNARKARQMHWSG